jgi:hypothetical protein
VPYPFDKVIPILFWLGFFALGIATSLDGQSKVYSKRGTQIAEMKTTAYDVAK